MWQEGNDMWSRSQAAGGGGGSLPCTEVYCRHYSSWYYFGVIDFEDMDCSYFDETYAGVGSVHTFKGMTVQRTAAHTYTFTATDGYYLYRGSTNSTSQLLDYGVNGSVTISNYYQSKDIMIASKTPLSGVAT